MIDYKSIFIDTSPFIYYIEKDENNPQYYDKIKYFFSECYNRNTKLVTSVITVEEYYVFPYRIGRMDYIAMFEKLINILDIDTAQIDAEISKKAAKIRAQYRYFKAMDAIQLSAACLRGCDLFLTNDKQLTQFKDIKCITIDDL